MKEGSFAIGTISCNNLCPQNELKFFIVYVFLIENADPPPGKLIQFITGAPSIPVLGLPNDIAIIFLHDCKASTSGTACNCYPTVSTCDIQLCLPVHITSDNYMIDVFKRAITYEAGFGRC